MNWLTRRNLALFLALSSAILVIAVAACQRGPATTSSGGSGGAPLSAASDRQSTHSPAGPDASLRGRPSAQPGSELQELISAGSPPVEPSDFFDFQTGGLQRTIEGIEVRESARQPLYNADPKSSVQLHRLAPDRRARFDAKNAVVKSVEPGLIDAEEGVALERAEADEPADRWVTSCEDELWVIQRPRVGHTPPPDDVPGSGALMALVEDRLVPSPLEHTAVEADINGYIASVSMTQSFHNPYSTKIEAVYVFPLPQNAAVNGFIMTIGDRRIRGVIREREEAERIYHQARAQGHVASLLNQERANVFTQRVANIEPNKSIDVDITYFHTLAYRDGWYSWRLPMVVGPRFNPPRSKDPILATPRLDPQASRDPGSAVPYLAPDERTGHDIEVVVNLDAGVAIEDIESPSHDVSEWRDGSQARIELAQHDRIPNRDLVLRWRVAGERVKSGLITHAGYDGNGYFSMMLVPPEAPRYMERSPVELVFVIDSSGSMRGEPLTQVKQAVHRGLDRLQPQDTFQIINFSNDTSQLGSRPLAATRENIELGKRRLHAIAAGGGTHMERGMKAALRFPHDRGRTRFVVFLTDGFIGHERDVLEVLDGELDDARVFSFGVGSSPNTYLMERMAKIGRGVVAYLNPGDRSEAVMDAFFDRVSRPALADIEIDWGGLKVEDVVPSRLPDLYAGRPVIITGRFDPSSLEPDQQIVVRGRAGREGYEVSGATISTAMSEDSDALPAVWARAQIAALADRAATSGRSFERSIRSLALTHNLMSAYTSFVAVDSMRVTAGESGVTTAVPVNVPAGTRYDTTVGGPGG